MQPWRTWQPGMRVVVRHRIDGGMLSDALGELVQVDDDALVIATRRGPVRVPIADITLGKRVPPPPRRRR